MTAPSPPPTPPPVGSSPPDAGEPTRLEVWHDRLGRLTHVESVLGLVLMLLWAFLASISAGHIAVIVTFLVLGALIHAWAVESGSHGLLTFATTTMLMCVVLATSVTFGSLSPVGYTICGLTVLGYHELIRLGHARRRHAVIDDEIYTGSALAIGLVAAGSIGGIAMILPLAESTERTWLWLPVAVLVLTVVAALLLIVPAWRAPKGSRTRWQPGERLPPALFDSDLDG